MIGYRCFACATAQDAAFDGFVCPDCGGNLDIEYDYDNAARAFPGAACHGPRDIFDYAATLPAFPDKSFPMRVGATPLYKSQRLGASLGLERLFLKDESGNPSASIKDRASAVALQRAIDVKADVIAAASTGNAGSSLACLSAALGKQAVVFVPEAAPVAKLTQLLSYGATVMAVRGNYDDAFELCLEACSEFGWFNRNTGYNPFTREGKKTCSYEIWHALSGEMPDRIVVATGDGNVLSGIWKGCRDLHAMGLVDRLPKIDAAQSTSSDAISRTVHKLRRRRTKDVDWTKVRVETVSASTLADSIAVDQPRDGLAAVKAIIESGGEAATVSDDEILAAIPEMSRLAGVFPEPAAAAPLAALQKMLAEKAIDPDERVVLIVSGSGLKDIGHAAQAAGRPTLVEPTLDAVKESLKA